MMPAKKSYGQRSSANVIPFPESGRASRTTEGDSGIQDAIQPWTGDAAVFAERVAQYLTVRMAKMAMAQAASPFEQWNPYDAIFISKLKADKFLVPVSLQTAITIEDRSGEIEFNDGWDS